MTIQHRLPDRVQADPWTFYCATYLKCKSRPWHRAGWDGSAGALLQDALRVRLRVQRNV